MISQIIALNYTGLLLFEAGKIRLIPNCLFSAEMGGSRSRALIRATSNGFELDISLLLVILLTSNSQCLKFREVKVKSSG